MRRSIILEFHLEIDVHAYYMRRMTETLGFAVTELSRLIRRGFDEHARAIGVTRAQWHTLFMLSRNEGINQGGLADLLEVEPITACRMIDRLEEAGLVERRPDPPTAASGASI